MNITTALAPHTHAIVPRSTVARTNSTPAKPVCRNGQTTRPSYREVLLQPGTSDCSPGLCQSSDTIKLPAFAPLIASQLAPLALIADDDVDVRKCLRLVLEIAGYRVEEVGRGMQALAILHHNPSLILLDINMPGLNGIECLREIRKRRPNTKVIIISGELPFDDTSSPSIGAFEYLPKPIDARRLLSAVGRTPEQS